MKSTITGKSMAALMLLLKYGNAIDQNHTADTTNNKDRDLSFVNPCTGEISRDEYDDDLPCITKNPTSFPSTQAPTSSSTAPTQIPSNAPSELNSKPSVPVSKAIENPIPQCFRCDYDSDYNENIVKVLFKYTVEISSADGIEKPDTYLPELEGKILENLSPIVLSHCSTKVDVRNLDNNPTSQYTPTKRRVLIAEKRLLSSICSTPTDEHLAEG